jgi:transposase InsO family protein
MSRQNYYKKRKLRIKRAIDEELILSLVRQERSVQPCLGGRKLLSLINEELTQAGVMIGRDRFFAFLDSRRLLIKKKAKRPRTTDSRHGFAVYENLLKGLTLTGCNQALVSDITYLRTQEGFVYLCLVMDAYSRAIVGYDCSDSLESEGAKRALNMALKQLPADKNVIHHSDRGCQYCSGNYTARLRDSGHKISMTQENHCYENAQAERLNGILKEEYGLGGGFLSKKDAYRSVREAIGLYNYRRPHQSLGYRVPMAVHEAA